MRACTHGAIVGKKAFDIFQRSVHTAHGVVRLGSLDEALDLAVVERAIRAILQDILGELVVVALVVGLGGTRGGQPAFQPSVALHRSGGTRDLSGIEPKQLYIHARITRARGVHRRKHEIAYAVCEMSGVTARAELLLRLTCVYMVANQ